uniref:Membrane protein insertase YidC n=1 Tax=Schlesneria paludicola TaxID=360056 RepID=A0A7C4LK48_9PLAN
MDQQRRLLTFITLSLAIMLLWTNVVVPLLVPPRPAPPKHLSELSTEAADRPVSALRPANVPAKAAVSSALPDHPPRTVVLGSDDPASGYFFSVRLSTLGASIESIRLNDSRYPEVGDRRSLLTIVGHDPDVAERTFATRLEALDKQLLGKSLENIHWEIVPGTETSSSVRFRIVSPDGKLELTKHYELQPLPAGKTPTPDTRDTWAEGYFVKLRFTVRNLDVEPVKVEYELRGPVGLPLEDPENASKHRDIRLGFLGPGGVVDDRTFSATEAVKDKRAKDIEVWKRPIQYIGVDTQYFAALLHPLQDQLKSPTIAATRAEVIKEGPEDSYADLSVTLSSVARTLQPFGQEAAEFTDEFVLFAGPKRRSLLAALKADAVLDYGWFAPIVVVMLWILNSLNAVGLNYGVAIIGLTCLVRAAIFPLSRYQARSMEKMKELQPKIKQLHEKHKKNPESLTREEMRTLQEVNLKMMWGCLPLLAQMPIFFALYRALQISVDLRMAPMHIVGSWIDNLAAPDALFPFGFRLPFLGWSEFNLLPVITIVLFILNQKLTMPPPADEEQALQYKMMNIMMGVMGIFFYRVPSGLCVYFITSSIWGMAERLLLKRWAEWHPQPASSPPVAAPESSAAKPTAARPSETVSAKPSLFTEWKNNLRKLQELADKPPSATREVPGGKGNRKRKQH